MRQDKGYLKLHRKSFSEIRKLNQEEKYRYDLIFKRKCLISENAEILTEDKSLWLGIKEHYGDIDFWGGMETFSVSDYFPHIDEKIKAFMDAHFMPVINSDTEMFSVACGDGESELYLADKVKLLDGFEYSEKMVQSARMRAKERNINNTSFHQADVATFRFERLYDVGMCFGLFICLDDKVAQFAISNMVNGLRSGGRLFLRDTVNLCQEECVYLFNYVTGYQAAYRNYEKYKKMITDAGLTLEYEETMNTSITCGNEFRIINSVWIKP